MKKTLPCVAEAWYDTVREDMLMIFDPDTMIRIAKATEPGALKICDGIETIPLETSEDLVNLLKSLETLWRIVGIPRDLPSDDDRDTIRV